jgi:peptidoglycan hydrolase-like protein with peptidoglycan-binding domain
MKLQKLALTALALSMSTAFAAGNTTDKQASTSNQATMASSNQPSASAERASANTAASSSQASSGNQATSNTAASTSNQPASSNSASGMASSEGAQADPKVRQVQQALKDKGHDPGEIDGIMGPQTQQALQSFQQAQGISGSGDLDQQTLAALGVQGDSMASASSSTNQPSSATGSMSSSANQPASSSASQPAPSSTNQPASSTNQPKQ